MRGGEKGVSRGIAPGSNECGSLNHCARFVFPLSRYRTNRPPSSVAKAGPHGGSSLVTGVADPVLTTFNYPNLTHTPAPRVRAALVSSGGVPPSLPGTPAGWLPGAKRMGRLLWSRGHERVPERGLDSPKYHRAGACCFIEIMGNSQIAGGGVPSQVKNYSPNTQNRSAS